MFGGKHRCNNIDIGNYYCNDSKGNLIIYNFYVQHFFTPCSSAEI